jgi:hypothetical protein
MSKWVYIPIIVITVILILIIVVSTLAKILFDQNANKEIKSLFSSRSKNTSEIIKKEELSELPNPVQKWLINSHIIGKEKIQSVRLKQIGQMRTKKEGPWMPMQAEQYFLADEPAFVWKANVKMAPLVHLSGIDNYREGKGRMSIKVLSLIPVVEASGSKMDISTMIRYLAEMPWFPTAALSPYIKWEPIDANSAKATMSYKGHTASGVFTFNEDGDIVQFMAKRYREIDGNYVLMDWGGVNKEFKEFNGIRIPSKSDVIWVEKSGDYNWFQCEITDIEYNKPDPY